MLTRGVWASLKSRSELTSRAKCRERGNKSKLEWEEWYVKRQGLSRINVL